MQPSSLTDGSPEWLPAVCVAAVVGLLGAVLLLRGNPRGGAGCRTAAESTRSGGGGSRLLEAEMQRSGVYTQQAAAPVPVAAAAAPAFTGDGQSGVADAAAGVDTSSHGRSRFRLGRQDAVPLPCGESSAEIWEVVSSEDAGALLAGCPQDAVICCSFTMPFADGMRAQAEAMRELSEAQPAGFVFASVDMKAAPEVAAWASVSAPGVRLLQADGVQLEHFPAADVGRGALHKKVLALTTLTARAAEPKLEGLALRFPKALHSEPYVIPLKDDVAKMRQHGLEALKSFGASSEEEEAFGALCDACKPGVGRAARVRHVAALARLLRTAAAGGAHGAGVLVPLLDLSRRLAAAKALGGSEAGAHEALELLLDAALSSGLGSDIGGASAPPTHCMLALQFLANCFAQPLLGEALLPTVGQALRTQAWGALWVADWPPPYPGKGPQAAAAAVLLNASVALRSARWRAEHEGLLAAGVDALRRAPGNEHLSLAVGNLLAVGGSQEDGKRVLQAQPLPPLRALAGAIFRGDLDGPDGCAFPSAWQPASSSKPGDRGGGQGDGEQRRPPRGPIPQRHRRRGGG